MPSLKQFGDLIQQIDTPSCLCMYIDGEVFYVENDAMSTHIPIEHAGVYAGMNIAMVNGLLSTPSTQVIKE